jgi:exoribonuclease R
VDRGGALEREAWRRGVTFYAPDRRTPLYPPALGEDAASLLADVDRPAVLFDLRLDPRGELRKWSVERARVRSRAQLTYADLREHGAAGGAAARSERTGGETLALLGRLGPLRVERERERGGVSLPIRTQHVQRSAATRLGFEVIFEEPNPAEAWNAQVSLLTGHAAATRMLEAGVGLLRTLAPPMKRDLDRFRHAAAALGFRWAEDASYADFMHALDPAGPHPQLESLVWQARRVMRGADYVAFDGEPPLHPEHAALAFPYAHCTAPLRRLADRYVLDLLLRLDEGSPSAAEIETLGALPAVMREAQRRASRLERAAVEAAEAWTLRGRVGETFDAVVLAVTDARAEVQIEEPPVRSEIHRPAGEAEPRPGAEIRVRLVSVDAAAGRVTLETAPPE